ncbi:hypothetical protein PI124_g19672 [Phytophthora idaei]|nr:hypothetical protein PI125_g9991 [Phytophthora idaei]KAG3155168.1 hypothetical protein PI126_g9298 [Phytophthora idaei]KAG3235284.1 hypothetical protein PI124_g19672 [Phytophthora idaei]
MARDLRVKASVRAPPPTEQRNLCAGTAYDATAYAAPPHVSSDEEWVDSAAGTCSNASSQSKQGRSGELDHPRSVQDESGNGQGLQRFEFESWEDLDSYLAEYTKRTYQSFRVRINNTVATRNNKTRSTGSKKPLLPDEWENYGKTFICTHSGTYKSRGKGKKKRLQSRAMECDAQINACVQVDDDTVPTFILRVTSARLVLNHPVNKHTYS